MFKRGVWGCLGSSPLRGSYFSRCCNSWCTIRDLDEREMLIVVQ